MFCRIPLLGRILFWRVILWVTSGFLKIPQLNLGIGTKFKTFQFITVTSWLARLLLKSPAWWLCTQLFVDVQMKNKFRVTGHCVGNSPVTRKVFLFDDVVMLWLFVVIISAKNVVCMMCSDTFLFIDFTQFIISNHQGYRRDCKYRYNENSLCCNYN